MTTPLLVSIDPENIKSESPVGLSLQQVAYLGACLITAAPETLESTKEFLRKQFPVLSVYVDVRKLRAWDDVTEILNAGAAKIFVTFEQLKGLSQDPTITPDRLVLTISPNNPQTDIAKLKAFLDQDPQWKTAQWAFDGDKGKDYVDDVLKQLSNFPPSSDQTIFVTVTREADGLELLHQYPGDSLIISSKRLTFDPVKDDNLIPATQLLLDGATADRKTGLYATVVIDERGVALGFVWSSKESVSEALKTGSGVYQSRRRGLWYKGASSGDTQELVSFSMDCDKDCIVFRVRQKGRGFCHLGTASCWGQLGGLSRLEKTLNDRKRSAPEGSYTARLFNDPTLVRAKIKEEADELCQAVSKENVAAEAADLLYFALSKCIAADVSLEDVERNLDLKSLKVRRRKGDAKPEYVDDVPGANGINHAVNGGLNDESPEEGADSSAPFEDKLAPKDDHRIRMKRHATSDAFPDDLLRAALQRPSQRSTDAIMGMVTPIIAAVRSRGDSAVLQYTHKFEKATSLKTPVLRKPFPEYLRSISDETRQAIDTSFANILQFHSAQKEESNLVVETMAGVKCSRFSRPIERVGLYIPGGTAVLPSTAMMLGVPAMAAGCQTIVMASPPRADGSISPEIVYIAHKVGAESIVLAGGAQAIAAMAYGTESVSKVDKILGPGNQFVTAAKMVVSNDTSANVSIDMPAGPSELLVIADKTAQPAFVASDLLSQAEHGADSQVILIAVDLSESQLGEIENQLDAQAKALPRVEAIRGAISHSITISVPSISEAIRWSNYYAPEHLILQVDSPHSVLDSIQNAGSVFIGPWTPESVGDYSAGVNHSLPTYGYARQYSGVNLGSFTKHVTSSELTEEGLKGLGGAVMQLARVEGLEAHRRAVEIRLEACKV
jgi:phosphoribosyl-ATP pyrophosphohydrolase / phosphoribosyl-AMP cyclohydrolase / histidinol dehydrogenase